MLSRGLVKVTAIVVISIFTLTSCGLPPPGTPLTPEERERAKSQCIAQHVVGGAIVGGITGALLGGLTGRRAGVGAVLGAIAGGVLAYMHAWSKCIEYFSDVRTFPVADYKTTAQNIGYNPAQGDLVMIRDFTIDPQVAIIGVHKKITPQGRLILMSPRELKDIEVVQYQRIYVFDNDKKQWLEGKLSATKDKAELGERRIGGGIDLPDKMDKGEVKMRFEYTIEALNKQTVATAECIVKKAEANNREYEVVVLWTSVR